MEQSDGEHCGLASESGSTSLAGKEASRDPPGQGQGNTLPAPETLPMPWDESACLTAIQQNDVRLLMWLRTQDPPCPWSVDVSASGHMDMLKWMRRQDPPAPWCSKTCSQAAKHGHWDILMWAREQNPPCPWDKTTCRAAAEEEDWEMLTWLRSQTPRCPWDDWTATVAYEHGHMSVGAWFGELWQSSKKKLRPPAPSLGATTLQGFRGRSSLDFTSRGNPRHAMVFSEHRHAALSDRGAKRAFTKDFIPIYCIALICLQMSLDPQQTPGASHLEQEPLTGFHDAVAQLHREELQAGWSPAQLHSAASPQHDGEAGRISHTDAEQDGAPFQDARPSFAHESTGSSIPSQLVQGSLLLEAHQGEWDSGAASPGPWLSATPSPGLRLGRVDTRRGPPKEAPAVLTARQVTTATEEASGFASRQRVDRGPLPSEQWASCRHINGVSIFEEKIGPEGTGGAFMVSSIIRAAPSDALKAVAVGKGQSSVGEEQAASIQAAPSDALKVLIDHGRYVSSLPQVNMSFHPMDSPHENQKNFEVRLQPQGFWGGLCAPRVCQLQQSVRETEDGTLLVLFHEQPPSASQTPPPPWWSWFSPVSVSVYGGGWTISPMRPELQSEGHAVECLVTLVIRADLNGWLGTGHSESWGPAKWIASTIRNAFIDPLLMSIITVRELVEHDKFVVKPFCMTHENIAQRPGEDMRDSPRAWESSERRFADGHARPAESRPQQSHAERRFEENQTEAAASRQEGGGGAAPSHSSLQAAGLPAPHPLHGSATANDLSCLQSCQPLHSYERSISDPSMGAGVNDAGLLGALDKEYWSCPGAVNYKVRGPNYLQDKKKIPAAEPIFTLAAADLVETARPMTHIAQHLPSLRHSRAAFSFVWQDGLMDTAALTGTPFDRTLARFLEATDKERNNMFKLIPNVAKGSWVIKQSVGHSPVLLGNKLKTHYFRTDRYMEVDVDVASSSAANTVVKLVQGATRHLVVDMAILLEGHSADELPEALLGTVRFSQLDMRKSQRLEVDTQGIVDNA
ncbi:hypothetical protein WJX84_008795 [Apatococcus fuscideae]|uniref:Protein ENHANCED DISEASE RESISTANCE 2 C-terminal domain-containing protein n=1 Tax=Apatococcus fuscideae TaxID=2026836 RepID=A0AAW1SX71_9CHLO